MDFYRWLCLKKEGKVKISILHFFIIVLTSWRNNFAQSFNAFCCSRSYDAVLNDMKASLLSDVIHAKEHYTLFFKQRFFSTQPYCCLTFS